MSSHHERPSVKISSFVCGDEDGALTHEIARALSASGLIKVGRSESDFRLEATLSEAKSEVIGYRLDQQKVEGEIRKNLVATEGRRSATLEVTLYERDTDKIALGPYRVAADADYDFIDGDSLQDLTFRNAEGESITVLPFSLGQLEPSEAAYEASGVPLYTQLAQKVVDLLLSEEIILSFQTK